MTEVHAVAGTVSNNFKVGERVFDHKGNNKPFIFTAEHIKNAQQYDCNRYGRASEAYKVDAKIPAMAKALSEGKELEQVLKGAK